MPDESVAAESADPLRSIAEAMDAAVKAATEGRDRALATAQDLAPAAGRVVSQAVYRSCYSVSFCAVLPVMLIARWIPRENAVVRGLIDGAHAAADSVDQGKSPPVSS
jgi:hypothetical protein